MGAIANSAPPSGMRSSELCCHRACDRSYVPPLSVRSQHRADVGMMLTALTRAAYGANRANAGSVYSLLLWMVACFTCGCCAIVPTPIKIDKCPIFLPPAHSFAMPLLLFGRRILSPFATFHFLVGVCYRPLSLIIFGRRILSPFATFHFWPAHPTAHCRPLSLLAGASYRPLRPPFTFGRRILSPIAPFHFWPAHSARRAIHTIWLALSQLIVACCATIIVFPSAGTI